MPLAEHTPLSANSTSVTPTWRNDEMSVHHTSLVLYSQ